MKSKSNLNLEEDMIQLMNCVLNIVIQLLNCVLNLVIFVLIIGKQNISKIKNYVQNNRKMIIINKICSILASIESIISSILIIFCYEYFDHQMLMISNLLKILQILKLIVLLLLKNCIIKKIMSYFINVIILF